MIKERNWGLGIVGGRHYANTDPRDHHSLKSSQERVFAQFGRASTALMLKCEFGFLFENLLFVHVLRARQDGKPALGTEVS